MPDTASIVGPAEMTIFDRLKADHDQHRLLLDKIGETVGESNERKALFEEFAVEVKGHAASEEQALYAAMMSKPSLTDKSRHSVSEHKDIEKLINEVAEADMATGGWLIKFRSLKHKYLHHIDEEEEETFPAAAKMFSAEEEQTMRKTFDARKPKEKSKATVGGETKED